MVVPVSLADQAQAALPLDTARDAYRATAASQLRRMAAFAEATAAILEMTDGPNGRPADLGPDDVALLLEVNAVLDLATREAGAALMGFGATLHAEGIC